jgi:FKBP-type peptidyl-prolyl cis-trans isomerase
MVHEQEPSMKRSIIGIAAIACTVALVALAAPEQGKRRAPALAPPTTEADKTLYALGLMMSRNLEQFRLSDAELQVVIHGLSDGVLDQKRHLDPTEYQGKIGELADARIKMTAEENKKAGQEALDKAVASEGVTRAEGGFGIKTLQEGSGASPAAADTVKVHYTGTLLDGTVFGSSVQRGQPVEFALGRVVKCWTEGLQLMKEGGKATLWCPSDTAYGDNGRPPQIPPGALLKFEVELLEIKGKPEPAPEEN